MVEYCEQAVQVENADKKEEEDSSFNNWLNFGIVQDTKCSITGKCKTKDISVCVQTELKI